MTFVTVHVHCSSHCVYGCNCGAHFKHFAKASSNKHKLCQGTSEKVLIPDLQKKLTCSSLVSFPKVGESSYIHTPLTLQARLIHLPVFPQISQDISSVHLLCFLWRILFQDLSLLCYIWTGVESGNTNFPKI